MNGLSSYERALLERLVPERERQRRTRDESRSKLPFYDNAIPAAEQPDPNLETPCQFGSRSGDGRANSSGQRDHH